MAGCSVVVLALGAGVLASAVVVTYFGVLGLCLLAGILLIILSTVVMKTPEIRVKHKVLRVVCIIIGIAIILFAVACIAATLLLYGAVVQGIP